MYKVWEIYGKTYDNSLADIDKKFELMLTRREKAYSSSGSVV